LVYPNDIFFISSFGKYIKALVRRGQHHIIVNRKITFDEIYHKLSKKTFRKICRFHILNCTEFYSFNQIKNEISFNDEFRYIPDHKLTLDHFREISW